MNTISLLLYAIFFVVVLLMVIPSIAACYRYWFGGGKLLSERLDAHFRSIPTTDANRRKKVSGGNTVLSGIPPKSIAEQSTHPIRTNNSMERR